MRLRLLASVTFLMLSVGFACAASSNDEAFANAALRELHNVARASAKSEMAAKDSDRIGCQEGYENLHSAAHEALTNMHQMSFAPIDAFNSLSGLLRVSDLSMGGCPTNDFGTMLAGQTILRLRTDYTIGNDDWYTIKADGTVEGKNPLIYAQSLIDENFSWVDVRPKELTIIVVSDWKAEMASIEVADSALANGGKKIDAVELGYRKNADDKNTLVYFYRTQEDALAASEKAKRQSDEEAKAEADLKASSSASKAEWGQKFLSLSYLVANHDAGFKVVYSVCKETGKNADGSSTCREESSHDWSDKTSVPYRWFNNFQDCEDASYKLRSDPPIKVSADESLVFDCLPASKPIGRVVKGYMMIFTLTAPEASNDDNLYAELRGPGHQAATTFSTFNACYDSIDDARKKTLKDLGADTDGKLLSDDTKTIDLIASCTRVY